VSLPDALSTLRWLPRRVQHAHVADVLRREIAAVLDTDASLIDTDQSLAYLGVDSQRAALLQVRLSQQWRVALPMEALAFADTIDGLADLFVRTLNGEDVTGGGLNGDALRTAVDADLTLDALPAAGAELDIAQVTHPRHILLTGATGYVGAFLLHDLLTHTDAVVHCLVRASDAATADRRVSDNLQRYGLWSDAWRDRIAVEPGDLSREAFGWTSERYRALAARIDAIHHNGASVHLLWSYGKLRGPNVLGTRAILRFAASERVKPVFFMSTAGIFDTPEMANAIRIDEDDWPRDVAGLPNGYTQSKWAGERLMALARDAGIPVTVFRVGPVLAESGAGVVHMNDLLARAFFASLDLGVAPVPPQPVDIVPVDYVARTVGHLALRVDSRNRTFHIVNPAPLTRAQLHDLLQTLPRPLELVPLDDWLARAIPVVLANPHHPLFPALDLLRAVGGGTTQAARLLERALARPPLECQRTLDALGGTGITCPPAHTRLREALQAAFPF